MNEVSRQRLRRHLLYAVVLTALAVLAGYRGVLPVFRSRLMAYLGIGDDRFGLLFSIGPLAGLASVLFGGAMIDRWGPRRVIRVCLMGVGAAMLIVALGGAHFGAFAAAVAVAGGFAGPLNIAVNAYLAKLFPRHQRRIISLNLASASLGGMMFPLVAEGLLTVAARRPGVTFAHVLHGPFLAAGLALLASSFIYRRRSAPIGNRPASTSVRRWRWQNLLLPPKTWMLAGLIGLHGTADTTLNIWMSRFLESRSFSVQPFAPGLVLSGFALAYILSRGLLATLPDRFGRRTMMVLPGLLGGSIALAGILSRSYVLTGGGYVLGAFCWSAEYPTMVSALLRQDRKRFGAAMAVAGLAGGLMLFGTMNLTGWLVARVGEESMWKVMAAIPGGFLLVGLGGLCWTLASGPRAPARTSTPEDPLQPCQTQRSETC